MTTMDKPSYSQLLAQARQLEPADQLRLLEGLAVLLRQQLGHGSHQPITALRGLGREVWQGSDAQEYVDRERATWDG
jgi:hypothetical protein